MRPWLRPSIYVAFVSLLCTIVNFPLLGKTDSLVIWISVRSACIGSYAEPRCNRASQQNALLVQLHLLCAFRLHYINTFWGMSLGNCLEWKIKHFSYCCRYTEICMMLDIYSYTMWYMRQYLGIVQIFLFFVFFNLIQLSLHLIFVHPLFFYIKYRGNVLEH